MKNRYTSLKLSKKLKENGCDLTPSCYDSKILTKYEVKSLIVNPLEGFDYREVKNGNRFYSMERYDLIWDICIKYAKEFFGEMRGICFPSRYKTAPFCVSVLINYLQQNKEQEAEDYIWETCLFNPKNKREEE